MSRRVNKLLNKKSKQWMDSFIKTAGSPEEADRRMKEWGARGGTAKVATKGFGSDPERARKAALKSAEVRRNKSE